MFVQCESKPQNQPCLCAPTEKHSYFLISACGIKFIRNSRERKPAEWNEFKLLQPNIWMHEHNATDTWKHQRARMYAYVGNFHKTVLIQWKQMKSN